MTILVTGGAGFIGANLVRHLIHHTDHRVITLDKLTYAGNLLSLASVLDHPRHTFIQADIADAKSIAVAMASYQPDAIMHLAAESHVDRSIDGPAQFMQTNIVGTFTLLEAARNYWERLSAERRSAFRFLHVSTDEVFGSLAAADLPFCESTAYAPRSPYSASKASADHLVRAWHHTYGLPTLITNCSNNYGPYQFPEKLIPVVILKALCGEAIPVYGKGENIRDWIHVQDHVEALCQVLWRGQVGETYLIGGDNPVRNIDLVRMLCRLLDELAPAPHGARHEQRIAFVPDRPGHDLRYAIDSSKIRRELAWHPRQVCLAGLRNTVQWYLEHRDWYDAVLSGEYRLERLGTHTAGGGQ